jgi:hypothetical protein
MRALSVPAFLILCVATADAQESADLKWTLKEGTTFFANGVTDMDMSMQMLNMDIDMKMKMTAVQRFKVLSAKPGATKVELAIQKMDMEMTSEKIPGGIPGLGGVGERVKGSTLIATLDDKFAVTKLEGYDKFLEKLAGDDEAMRKQMKQQFSEEAVKHMFTQVFAFAPDKPVRVGESWTRTDKMPAAGLDAVVKQKYKLDSVSNGVAKVALTGDMTFKAGNAFPGLPEGVQISKFDMKADKFAGNLLFDTKAGRLTENKLDMDMKGDMTIGVAGQTLDISMKIKARQTTTISDKNPVVD